VKHCRQGGDRRLPAHPAAHADAEPGAAPDHVRAGPPEEAVVPGTDPRPQPPLLLHQHQLQHERAGAEGSFRDFFLGH